MSWQAECRGCPLLIGLVERRLHGKPAGSLGPAYTDVRCGTLCGAFGPCRYPDIRIQGRLRTVDGLQRECDSLAAEVEAGLD